MKKILITGANSYIGTSFDNYVKEMYPEQYQISTLDMKNSNWKNFDFSSYDSVFHVAGIAHSDNGKISKEKEKMYYSINTDLAVETAKKAKQDGAKQFIFMSSIIVYGNSAPIGKKKVINLNTPLAPANCYGDSKVQAEKGLQKIESEDFKVVILRPPMIYGENCKGNYQLLVKFAKYLPFFPYIKNERSMLYIENLNEFVRLMIENEECGIFYPQNSSYVNTSEMVQTIGKVYGKKLVLIKGISPVLKLLSLFTNLVNKAFGNLAYSSDISVYKQKYQIYNLFDSIKRTEDLR